MVEAMTSSREGRAEGLEAWADEVEADELVEADRVTLRLIAEFAEKVEAVDEELTEAVREARRANRSWSEIAAMLGVSKQAAQRRFSRRLSA